MIKKIWLLLLVIYLCLGSNITRIKTTSPLMGDLSDHLFGTRYNTNKWLLDTLNGNYSHEVLNQELIAETKKSGINFLNLFFFDFYNPFFFASPSDPHCRDFMQDQIEWPPTDTSKIPAPWPCFARTMAFAESLEVGVTLHMDLQSDAYGSCSPFPDTVCSFTFRDSVYYYYESEAERSRRASKMFHYLFGNPDAEGDEGGWAGLRAKRETCDDCGDMAFCGHNHPEPFDCIEYISFHNDGMSSHVFWGYIDSCIVSRS